MNIVIYDDIFNHRAIQVPIGLAGLTQLKTKGYFVAYYQNLSPNYAVGFYIVRCKKCGYNYLSSCHVAASEDDTCPICHGKGVR